MATDMIPPNAEIPFKALEKISQDMNVRFHDLAMYYALLDALEGNDDFYLVGKNIFRIEQKHPRIDRLVADKKLIVELYHDK